MHILREESAVAGMSDPALRRLLQHRIREICPDEPWDAETLGYFIVVEAGDSVAALEQVVGCPILGNRDDEARFPDADFIPGFEWLDEHAGYYEGVWLLSDSGFGVILYVPKEAGVDVRLLAMCAAFATVPVAYAEY